MATEHTEVTEKESNNQLKRQVGRRSLYLRHELPMLINEKHEEIYTDCPIIVVMTFVK
jgi:chorismate-pyruvate lyase